MIMFVALKCIYLFAICIYVRYYLVGTFHYLRPIAVLLSCGILCAPLWKGVAYLAAEFGAQGLGLRRQARFTSYCQAMPSKIAAPLNRNCERLWFYAAWLMTHDSTESQRGSGNLQREEGGTNRVDNSTNVGLNCTANDNVKCLSGQSVNDNALCGVLIEVMFSWLFALSCKPDLSQV